jgi:hypothetical protein
LRKLRLEEGVEAKLNSMIRKNQAEGMKKKEL